MSPITCALCGVDLDPDRVVHADEIPDRAYCASCSGCAGQAPENLCDACYARAQGTTDLASRIITRMMRFRAKAW